MCQTSKTNMTDQMQDTLFRLSWHQFKATKAAAVFYILSVSKPEICYFLTAKNVCQDASMHLFELNCRFSALESLKVFGSTYFVSFYFYFLYNKVKKCVNSRLPNYYIPSE